MKHESTALSLMNLVSMVGAHQAFIIIESLCSIYYNKDIDKITYKRKCSSNCPFYFECCDANFSPELALTQEYKKWLSKIRADYYLSKAREMIK